MDEKITTVTEKLRLEYVLTSSYLIIRVYNLYYTAFGIYNL